MPAVQVYCPSNTASPMETFTMSPDTKLCAAEVVRVATFEVRALFVTVADSWPGRTEPTGALNR